LTGSGYFYFQADSASYEGNFVNGKYSGMGIFTNPGGQVFTGIFEDGTLNGKGKWTHPKGNKYEGNFKNGGFDGYGVMKYYDGWVYKGNWTNSKRNGQGMMYDKDGNLDYTGDWNNSEMVNQEKSVSYKKELWEDAKKVFGRTYFEGTMDEAVKVKHEYHLNSDYTLSGSVVTHDISDNVCDRDFTGTYDPVNHTLHLVYGVIRLHTTKFNGELYTSFEGTSDSKVFINGNNHDYFQIKGTDSKGNAFTETDLR